VAQRSLKLAPRLRLGQVLRNRTEYFRRGLSLRARIGASLLLAFLALGPPVGFALYYLDQVLQLTDRVVTHDVHISTRVEDLAKHILQAQAEIRALLVDYDAAHLQRFQELTGALPNQIAELRPLLGAKNDAFTQLAALTEEYGWRSDSLAVLAIRQDARQLVTTRHWARLDAVTDDILDVTDRLVASTGTELEQGRSRIEGFTMRARRNILTLLFATTLAELALILVIPRMIVLPLRRLVRLVRQAEQGRFDVRAEESGDEVGELGHSINRMLETFQQFDSLKLDKISELSSRFRAVAGLAEHGILVLDTDLRPVYANRWLIEHLGLRDENVKGLELQKVFADENIMHRLTGIVLDPVHDRFETRLRPPVGAGESVVAPVEVICRSALDRKGDIANFVLVLRDARAAIPAS